MLASLGGSASSPTSHKQFEIFRKPSSISSNTNSPAQKGLLFASQEFSIRLHVGLCENTIRSIIRSLNGTQEPRCNCPPGQSLRAQAADFSGVNFDRWPTQSYALGFGVPQTGPDALLNEGTLKFGHGSDYLEHQPPRWCAQVKVVAKTDGGDAVSCKIGLGRSRVRFSFPRSE